MRGDVAVGWGGCPPWTGPRSLRRALGSSAGVPFPLSFCLCVVVSVFLSSGEAATPPCLMCRLELSLGTWMVQLVLGGM